MSLFAKILLGMISGIIAGIGLGIENIEFINTWITPLGTIFLRLLQMMIIPLVFSSLVVGVYGIGDIAKLGRIGSKTFGMYMMTTLFAVCISIIVALIIEPGEGLNLIAQVPLKPAETQSIRDMFIEIFPSNPLQSMVNGNMMQIIVFGLAVGIGIIVCGDRVQLVVNFTNQVTKICYKVIRGIVKLAPIGVFGLMTPVIAQNGIEVLMPLIKLFFTVYLCLFLHASVVYGGMLKLSGINPWKFLKKIYPVITFAFSNCSSNATLPISITYCRLMNISKGISSFILPLGATINMDGTAVYQCVSTIFLAQIYGIEFNLSNYIYLGMLITLTSIGAAGIPGGGFATLTMVIVAMGLPPEAIALIAGIDRLLDMGYTALNVSGDVTVCGIVAKSEGEKLIL